jgi:transcriptional/translational regulatory protein YebC/TACO1
MTIRKHFQAIRDIADDLGMTGVRIEQGARHTKIYLDGPTGSKIVTTSLTPSDRRTLLNLRTLLRRVGRELGMISA